jgi:hypothetical protein
MYKFYCEIKIKLFILCRGVIIVLVRTLCMDSMLTSGRRVKILTILWISSVILMGHERTKSIRLFITIKY